MTAYTLLVNPACGGGRGAAAAESVARILRDAGHDVTVTPTPGPEGTPGLVDEAVARGDVLVMVGGDGTLSSVAGTMPSVPPRPRCSCPAHRKRWTCSR